MTLNAQEKSDFLALLEKISKKNDEFSELKKGDVNDPVAGGALWTYAIFQFETDRNMRPIIDLVMATDGIPQIAKEFLIGQLENRRRVSGRGNMERDNIAINALHTKTGECRFPSSHLFPDDGYIEMLEKEGLATAIDSNDQIYESLADTYSKEPESIEKAALARRKKEKEQREKAIDLMREASAEQCATNIASLEEQIKHLY